MRYMTYTLTVQVYKATVRSDGRPVAVKVQRPGVAASIALDVFILRQLAVVIRRWRKLNTDLPLLLDGWAASLFTELDYRQEAANGIRFKELYGQMEVSGGCGCRVAAMGMRVCGARMRLHGFAMRVWC